MCEAHNSKFKTQNSTFNTLHRRCSRYQPSVYAATYTEEEYTCCAESESGAGSTVALKCGQRSVGLIDEHALHNLQIVVE